MNRAELGRDGKRRIERRLRAANPAASPGLLAGRDLPLAGAPSQAAGGAASRGGGTAAVRVAALLQARDLPSFDPDEVDEAPGEEAEAAEEQILDEATAAQTSISCAPRSTT